MEINVSTQTLHMGWILGWAIPKSWFEAKVLHFFPSAKHTFIEPSESIVNIIHIHAPYDLLIGYSLGSLLLLTEKEQISQLSKLFILLAPILGFTLEEDLGGITPIAKLQFTKRSFNRNRDKTCHDFYNLTQLDVTDSQLASLDKKELTWGLEQLEIRAYKSQVPLNWRAYVGKNDPLVNVAQLLKCIPHLQVIAHATHEPTLLLSAMKEENL